MTVVLKQPSFEFLSHNSATTCHFDSNKVSKLKHVLCNCVGTG